MRTLREEIQEFISDYHQDTEHAPDQEVLVNGICDIYDSFINQILQVIKDH